MNDEEPDFYLDAFLDRNMQGRFRKPMNDGPLQMSVMHGGVHALWLT